MGMPSMGPKHSSWRGQGPLARCNITYRVPVGRPMWISTVQHFGVKEQCLELHQVKEAVYARP
eukprot:1903149-Alexandrium_andersonii.AAC.1